ncbi:MAG: DEAD/DEAH box helicase [Armatimonadota bacterium]|nr:DEAD/DEAH box helicase [Armatimonadota bacterium]MDW8156601.1 DEAD/DEAH box helicase [Armatimonadota bacterium]
MVKVTVDVQVLVEDLKRWAGSRVVHVERLPPRPARFADPQAPLPPLLAEALARLGIRRLYSHQARALDLVRSGRSVVVTTRTASGKTLCYNLPVLETLLADPHARALYLFPTKALAQDQLDTLQSLGLPVRCDVYDGDTPPSERARVREQTQLVLTNPDMLHVGILPQHGRWVRLFRGLRYVVLDDLHVYRGVFGSHVAGVIRRLRRVCRAYGSEPHFVCTSATLANPAELAERILGLAAEVVDEDGAPQGARWFVLWNPPPIRGGGRHSPYREASALLRWLAARGVRTIVFTKARKVTELVYRYAVTAAPDLAGRLRAYRAGYLPEERREIERALFSGELVGVVSTSALELGIDVGGLDAAVLVGFPGTVASTWQRAGRAGRSGADSLAVLVALDDALDQYLMRNPRYLFERPVEAAVLDPANPYVLASQLRCAAAELPLRDEDFRLFGEPSRVVVQVLSEAGELAPVGRRWCWRGVRYPASQVGIRTAGEAQYAIVEEGRGVLGTVDEARALEQVHPGAVYLHQGETYVVRRLDLQARVATVRRQDVDYYTEARTVTDLEVRRIQARRILGPTEAYLAEVEVTTQVVGYARKQLAGDRVLSVEPLALPPQTLRTVAVGYNVPDSALAELGEEVLPGAIHAAEHAAIGLLPLFGMCDRWDVGGVSYPLHPQTGRPSVFVYDGYPGGVGIVERGYQVMEEWLRATWEAVRTCPCEGGCPSCVQSPKCGNGNQPLHKEGAVRLLAFLLGQPVRPVSRRP